MLATQFSTILSRSLHRYSHCRSVAILNRLLASPSTSSRYYSAMFRRLAILSPKNPFFFQVLSPAAFKTYGYFLGSSRSMAGLQSWRRHTQLARPIDNGHTYHSQINDVAASDDTSYSTSPGADEGKLRPRRRRSLATFTSSYLGTHHRLVSPSSGSDWPTIDWSKLSIDNKEDDYMRDTETMCTAITQQVLANPSTDLPAQYSTFLLLLIEAYHQSKVDVQDLQMKLAEQTNSDKTKVNGVHGKISSWPREKTENANSSTLPSTRSTIVQQYNPAIQIPLPSKDKEQKGQNQGHADKTKSKSLKASHLSHADINQHRSVIN